ncbi:MAG: hypothetical protein PHF56_25005 [Desulfuromonadaceae bacterium]|nr:hypothetical protein [Desulfuromonadaceae bacterium]
MPLNNDVHSFKNATFSDEDFVRNGKITPLGIEYLLQFKRFNLFNKAGTAILFFICLPIVVPMAIVRLLSLFFVFGTGMVLKKYLSISLDNYPNIIRLIYFVCLGVYVRSKDHEQARTPPGPESGICERSTVILSNHNSRFDAMLLANLHQSDATYLAAARSSFFGKLIIDSGLCSRSMVDGIALDTKEGREEWRRRLDSAYCRPLLFFPEGRVVQKPNTIITFQNHLLQGKKVNIIGKKSSYTSYFLNHTQIEIPFFKAPYSSFNNKTVWDSIIEGIPFLVSFITVFETEVIGTVQLNGRETLEEINELLYSLYIDNGFSLVTLEPLLVKKLMQSLYL